MATRLNIFQSERSVHRARRPNDVLIWARHCAGVQETTSFRTAARGEHDEWNFRHSFQGRTGEDQCRADHTLRQRSQLRRRAQVGLAMYFLVLLACLARASGTTPGVLYPISYGSHVLLITFAQLRSALVWSLPMVSTQWDERWTFFPESFFDHVKDSKASARNRTPKFNRGKSKLTWMSPGNEAAGQK